MAISAWTRRNWGLHGDAQQTSFKSDMPDMTPGQSLMSDPRITTQISNIAAELSVLGTPVDVAKVAEVRQALALDRYQVSPDQVAEAMLNFAGKPD